MKDNLLRISQIDIEAAQLKTRLDELKSERATLEEQCLAIATLNNEGCEAYGYRVRWTKGRSTTKWDAEKLDSILPDALKAIALRYTPKASAKILKSLEDEGKLSPAALEAKTVSEAEARWKLEGIA